MIEPISVKKLMSILEFIKVTHGDDITVQFQDREQSRALLEVSYRENFTTGADNQGVFLEFSDYAEDTKEIDTEYYEQIAYGMEHDPKVLKKELLDLVNEVKQALNKGE